MNISSIRVTDLDGDEVDLINKYLGKHLLLIIYNNACLGCTGRAIPLAYEFQQKNESLQVIGIHSNMNDRQVTKEDILHIFTSKEVPFPIYIDANREVYNQFSAEGTPQWVLLTQNGELFRSIFGSMAGAHNRLLYAIDALVGE